MTEPALRLVPPADDTTDTPVVTADDLTAADAETVAQADALVDAQADADGDVPQMPGLTVTRSDAVIVTARHWASMVAASARRHAANPRSAINEEPPSIAHIAAYYKAGAWVPEHHSAEWLRPAGRAYGYCVGIPVVALLYGIAWLFARPVRIGTVVFVALAVTIAALA